MTTVAERKGKKDDSVRNNGVEVGGPEPGALQLLAIPLEGVRPGRNPRTTFDADGLQELAESLRQHGQLEPIVVRRIVPVGEVTYEIIAGERRWRAAKLAGLECVTAVVRPIGSEAEAVALALIENLVRRDIDPIDEARGYKALLDMGYMQQKVAQAVNRAQPTIANRLRLLGLPQEVLNQISFGTISPAHGLAMLSQREIVEHTPEILPAIARAAEMTKTT